MMDAAVVRSETVRSWRRAPLAVLRRLGAVLALLGMCAILTALSDHFLTFDNLMNVFRQSAVNALLALGQLLVIVTAGIDLSVGSILGFACVVAAVMLRAGSPGWVSALTASQLERPWGVSTD
jgi:ribose/xylose/arabinose/galactoside ABC-type transport system permease subunit